ncbi:hypothetical protein H5410_062640 [Solanum commersonii]|uniref:Retrotransposon gag domain-containing protein n=1 Tax=Solanum commersonii TaxID=4109 RepID=A0A9J5WBC8_SOLCO|nr:hypothetical protein H5410_062640 [Solanum commersonii]
MPPRRAVRSCPARGNVEPRKQGVPNAPEVQPQGEVNNAEFWEAIQMLSQATTNQFGQRENRQDLPDISRICEFLRMNPPSFIGNFVKKLQKVFEIMHVNDAKRVELVAYQMNGVARIWFNQWKRIDLKEGFLGRFFPHELREAKVREFLTLKHESMSVHE